MREKKWRNKYYSLSICFDSLAGPEFVIHFTKKQMPEGPSIVILKEQLKFAIREIIPDATGNALIDKSFLINARITYIKSCADFLHNSFQSLEQR